MPALWERVKSLGSRRKSDRDTSSRAASRRPRDKVRSFDETAASCRSDDGARYGGAWAPYNICSEERQRKSSPPTSCHPLPQPIDLELPAMSLPQHEGRRCSSGPSPSTQSRSGTGSGSGSVSSISSSGSDDTPDLRSLRISEQASPRRREANGTRDMYAQRHQPPYVCEDDKQVSSASPSPDTNGRLLPLSSILKIHPKMETETPTRISSTAGSYLHQRASSEFTPSPGMIGYLTPSSSPGYLRSPGICSESPIPTSLANMRNTRNLSPEKSFTPLLGSMRNAAIEPESPTILPYPVRIRSTGIGLESPIPSFPANIRSSGVSLDSPTREFDDRKSPSHLLPLPPNSPTSSAAHSPSSLGAYSPQSKWVKGKPLGRGTFGRVYVGLNSETGQMCAIKEVEVISDDSNSKECLKHLCQEIDLLSRFSHPNIVQYYGSELNKDNLSIYLEFVSGGSIHRVLQDFGPLTEPLIRTYTRQILSGIAYLHGRNCIHRDIKGANILVEPNGTIKLADFGTAKHISSCASIRSFKGSPYWMAPEVIMNFRGYNFAVDIWSLGCTIIEMATSKPPWSQHTGVQAIFKIGNSKDTPDIPEHLSEDGKSFLKLCLQRDPSARPTAAQLMNHPFVQKYASPPIPSTNIFGDPIKTSPSHGSYSPIAESSYRRSGSALTDRDHAQKQVNGHAPTFSPCGGKDHVGMGRNLSLPVSPTYSPLRQHKPKSRICIPSPPHQPSHIITDFGQKHPKYPVSPMRRYTDERQMGRGDDWKL